MKKNGCDVVIVLTSSGVPWDREDVYNTFINLNSLQYFKVKIYSENHLVPVERPYTNLGGINHFVQVYNHTFMLLTYVFLFTLTISFD